MELPSSLLLAPSLRPPSNLLLRILLFLLLLWPNASLLWLNASLCRCTATGALARHNHQLTRTHVETNVRRKLTVTARTIFSPPHKAQMVSEGESQGRHLDTGVRSTRKHDRRARTAISLVSWTDKDVCQRPCAITCGPHRPCPLWKKVWSPTCLLNGCFQSPNCPLKGFFHSPTGFFSRKWPDGGRFFEPWFPPSHFLSHHCAAEIRSSHFPLPKNSPSFFRLSLLGLQVMTSENLATRGNGENWF